MRIYLPPALSNLLTSILLVASLGAAAYIGFRAFQTFSSDSALDQIPSVIQKSNPKTH